MLIAVIALSTILAMLIHELGHLAAARACGVTASELSLGMGRKLCGFQIGSVSYNLRLLPLGSFIRLNTRELHSKPLSRQLIVHLAGVFVNLVVASAAFGTIFGWVNLLLALANLLPIYQHDGWKCGVAFIRALLGRRSSPVEWTLTFSGAVISLVLLMFIRQSM